MINPILFTFLILNTILCETEKSANGKFNLEQFFLINDL